MTNSSLPSRNSGLRVFNAGLLSALLIMMPFVQLAAASRRESATNSRGPETARQVTDTRQETAAAPENVFANAPIPKPAPEPLVGPVIVATKDDGLATATTVAPGGTINYSVNIKNNGSTSPADDATGVTFTDIIDSHTTLVVDSAVAAVSDRYNAIGNVQLSIPDGSTDLLANDIDPDTGSNVGMTATAETKSSTQCAGCNNVTINANGSFTYDPPVGFAGTDTFTYTAHSTVGGGTAAETVTITVANEIWFINSDPTACTSNCDGRLSHPFKTLAAFNAVNDGAAGHPGDNDWIFLFESATDYAGPATLRTGQKLIGQDATASLATLTGFPAASGTDQLPAMNSGNGTIVNITATNVNGINLNSGNTLRGFTVGNVGTGTKISGTSFGTLTVGNNGSPDVTLNGTGRTLNLVTGTFAASSGFVSVASSSMTGQGMTLTSVAGTVLFGSTTISSASTQCIQVSTSTANINFGATSCSGGTEGVVLSSNGAGTRTFGTLSITTMTAGGFIYSGSGSGGGDVNVTGAANISVAGNAISVSAPASGDLIDFQATTSATSSGLGNTAVFYSGVLGAELKFNSLSIQRNGTVANPATALSATGGGTVTVTNALGGGTINNTTSVGPAIVAANIALNANFSSINSSGGNNGVSLTSVTGTSNFGTGQLTGTAGGATFLIAGGTASVTYSGSITQAAANAMVSIFNHSSGTILFQTGILSATLGTGLQFSNDDGTYTFSGTTTLGGGDAGIDILDGSAGTFSFGASTTITNPSGVAVNVDGSGALNPVTGGITLAGSISKTSSGRLIDFSEYDTGTATISATLSCTSSCGGIEVTNDGAANSGTVNFTAATQTLNTAASTAVNLDNNDSGNVNFTGGNLDIDTTSGVGFNATNGGTITVTGSNNTINSVSAAALNVTSTTIGAADLIFKRIDSGNATAAADPVNGIVLSGTGSAGNLSITGNNTLTQGGDGSGGTIQNTTGNAVTLVSTLSPTFVDVTILTPLGHGISGDQVTNFSFTYGTITAAGNGAQESAISFSVNTVNTTPNITGTLTITNSNLTNMYYSGVDVQQSAGTITNAIISDNTITSTTLGATSQGFGINFNCNGTSTSTFILEKATINNNTITNFPTASGIQINGGNSNASGTGGQIGFPGDINKVVTITNNKIAGLSQAVPMNGSAIIVAVAGGNSANRSKVNVNISNNGTVANPITNVFGTVIGVGCNGYTDCVAVVDSNRISANQAANVGGGLGIGGGDGVAGAGNAWTPDMTYTVTNNVISGTDGNGILIVNRQTNGFLDLKIANNNVGAPVNAGGTARYGIRVDSGNTPTAGQDTNVCLNISGNTSAGSNGATGIGVRKEGSVATTNDFGIQGIAQAVPTNPQVEAYITAQNPGASGGGQVISGSNFVQCSSAPAFFKIENPNRLYEVAQQQVNEPTNSNLGATASLLLTPELPAAAEMISAGTDQVTKVSKTNDSGEATNRSHRAETTNFETLTANLTGTEGQKSDVKAHHATSEVGTQKSDITRQTSEVGNRDAGLKAHYAVLSKVATRNATAAPAPMSGETVTASIGTLPAGGSVTISFQVTVNNPPNLTLLSPPRVENQGTVSGGNFSSVLTDDPNVVGAADKTATRIDLFDTTTSLVSDVNPSNDADPVTFTATINETPSQGSVDPTGTVDFIDTSNGNAVICNDVAVSASSAQCVVSNLSAGSTHNIRADYSGDGNFDPSQSNLVAQVVNACAINPVVTKIADTNDGVCDGDCSLREAIATVCSAPNNTITFNEAGVFATAQTIALTMGELVIAKNLTINAPDGANHVTVSGGGASRVFKLNTGKTATLRDFTVSGGSVTGNGGGILNDHGVLLVLKMTISGNTATVNGGGIFSDGAGGTATTNIIASTISGNTATTSGGGISNDGTGGTANLTITNSTISGNNADESGGGLNDSGTLTVYNSTFTNNKADNNGDSTGTGGGIFRSAGTGIIHNTIVAGNFNEDGVTDGRDDVFGALFGSSDSNLIGDGTGMTGISNGTNGNQVGTGGSPIDAMLGPLTNNGGPTNTHALLPTSPAIEAGNNTIADGAGLTEDQRGTGYPRKADSADANTTQTVDIGAFELHPSIEDIADTSTNEDTAKLVVFNLGDDTGTLITGGTVAATSSNGAVVMSDLAHLSFTGSGGSRTLTINPNTNASGVTTITITVTATNGRTATDSFDLTVNAQNDNPTITNNTGHTVNEGSAGNVIDNTKLKVDDVDNTSAQVTFTVGTAPANGTLKNNGAGLSSGGTFTQADIDGGLLTYDHNGSETTSDSFTFSVSDGAGGSAGPATFNITVTPQNDNPTIGNNTGTTVNEGSTGNIIDSAKLSVNDVDNTAAQITYTVGTAPANGTLRKSGGALAGGGTFTQADINGNLLTYDHNGTETTSDSFTFTVSDGAGGSIGSTAFNITVTLQNDVPAITNNTGITVNEASTANVIDNTKLKVDDGDNTAAQIIFTVGAAPANGTLKNNGVGLSTGGTFTQADINSNLLTYDHNGSETTSDSFTFTVSDGVGGSIGSTAFNITVTPQNDNPTLTTNAGLSVLNAGTGTIDNTKLKVDDADNTAAQLTFTVGTAPINGTLKKGVATLSAGGTFTQADIDGNQITYTHNGTATTTDSFNFTVSDGAGGSIGSTTFNITIGNPNLSINDAKAPEPSTGTADMAFTVALASPAGAGGASVNFQTNNGTANAGTCGNPGADYVSTSGTVNFIAGEQVKTINVPICSDAVADDGETFTVTLSGAVNAVIVDNTATGTITANTPGTLLISELRTSGPGGANDDFVEIYNNTNAPITVPAGGYGLFKKGADCNGTLVLSGSPVLVGTIPAATVIPARGHYLFVGTAYSLANYGGAGAAAGDIGGTLTSDIENDANVGLFATADITQISSVNRFDAVGFGLNTGGTCNLLREGSTLPPMSGSTLEYSYFRKACDWIQGSGCTVNSPKDTNNNAEDFWLADTTAAAGITGRLGAPGPENINSPIRRDNANNPGSGGINVFLLDSTKAPASAPNRERKGTDPEFPGSTFGTMTLRYRVVNNTGGQVTRLRYRIVDISTAVQPAGPTADLRALTGVSPEPSVGPVNDPVTCAPGGTPCNVTVNLTTLETPPGQGIGGGYNSTLSSGTITTLAPLNNGSSILINFKLGVEKTGTFRFYIIVEALP